MPKLYNFGKNLVYQEDNNHDDTRSVKYRRQPIIGNKSSIRRNLFPDRCPTLYFKTRSALSSSITRMNRAFNTLKNKISSAAQNLNLSGYKRHTLEDCQYVPSDFQTPSRGTRVILGRTPIKLYSPFGIETPVVPQ